MKVSRWEVGYTCSLDTIVLCKRSGHMAPKPHYDVKQAPGNRYGHPGVLINQQNVTRSDKSTMHIGVKTGGRGRSGYKIPDS